MSNPFPQYTTDYISGVMSLRKPQAKSLQILAEIMGSLNVTKDMNLKASLGSVHAMYPICSDFERDFMSLTFALATGVGKTRLMGAFIAYLYTNHKIRNYFVVAPGKTVYEKLKQDLGDPANPKYVFKGLGCFSTPPEVITDDDYRTKPIGLFTSAARIFLFNIDKFNKEESRMKRINEVIGDSFYNYLANLPDLVVLMDESHHYRADKGMQAINELRPLLGLELTATPLVTSGAKQIPFKNVVYEYPLSQSIEDGYTRTPFATTRSDINDYNFGAEELDELMLRDGLKLHERAKRELEIYFRNNHSDACPIRRVKPFMMVVCKDTEHAVWVENFIKSEAFGNGAYKDKTVIVHSKQSGAESDANTELLLNVEHYDNPVEIVIHVNMLKEGWDVNNLYTIVPLRTAASQILREQMVGRGLRLPYGKRTGNEIIDAVYLTAHDKFQEIMEEAQKGDSIFKAGNVIRVNELEEAENISTPTVAINPSKVMEDAAGYDVGDGTRGFHMDAALEVISKEVTAEVIRHKNVNLDDTIKKQIAMKVVRQFKHAQKEGQMNAAERAQYETLVHASVTHISEAVKRKYLPIPQLEVIDQGSIEYGFVDFDMDLSDFNHVPVEDDLLLQNLVDQSDLKRIDGDTIDVADYNAQKAILEVIREKPEIDYEKCSSLLFRLISQVCQHYTDKYDETRMRKIVLMNKRDIANKIYRQMMADDHFYCDNGDIRYSVAKAREYNFAPNYTWSDRLNLYARYEGNIKSVLFEDIRKGVFASTKFDSYPELILARVLEKDATVSKWLRPAPNEFNITYNRGRRYVPDFVVETKDGFYIVEVKGEDKINDADVLAKSKKAVQFCAAATNWAQANGTKKWRYVFIPSQEIRENSSFANLVSRFQVEA